MKVRLVLAGILLFGLLAPVSLFAIDLDVINGQSTFLEYNGSPDYQTRARLGSVTVDETRQFYGILSGRIAEPNEGDISTFEGYLDYVAHTREMIKVARVYFERTEIESDLHVEVSNPEYVHFQDTPHLPGSVFLTLHVTNAGVVSTETNYEIHQIFKSPIPEDPPIND